MYSEDAKKLINAARTYQGDNRNAILDCIEWLIEDRDFIKGLSPEETINAIKEVLKGRSERWKYV